MKLAKGPMECTHCMGAGYTYTETAGANIRVWCEQCRGRGYIIDERRISIRRLGDRRRLADRRT